MYFTQKKAELMGAGNVISMCVADPMSLTMKRSRSPGLPSNYRKMYLHEFMSLVYSTFGGKEVLKLSWILSH